MPEIMYHTLMSIENITEKLREKLTMAPHIGAKIKFDFGDEGIIFIDGTQTPPTLSHEDEEADTTLACSTKTLEGIAAGTQDPSMAFMMGKLKVRGSMGLALKLASILED